VIWIVRPFATEELCGVMAIEAMVAAASSSPLYR
jgi:hypothetical protein